MTDNKLSELSEPVAWDFPGSKEESRQLGYDFELDDEQKVNCSALYSQEYVSALLAELEAADKRIAELEAKMATPVRLPALLAAPSEYASSILWAERDTHNATVIKCVDAIRAAGFTVEGDE